jgi:glycosyltransferase involved in cell wall biosynthesis
LVPSGLVAALAARKRPHLAVAHSADVWLLDRAPGGRAVVRAVARGATALAAVSPKLRAELLALAGHDLAPRTALLPLGPDRLPAPPAAATRSLRQDVGAPGLLVAALARLVPIKGVDVLVRALGRPEARGVAAVVAGEGPERAQLQRMARLQGTPVRFIGEVGPDGRSALLGAADALVVPSVHRASGREEGLPVSALEGLAAGLPVVASRVGGLPWALGDAGLLVEPGSARSLAAALARLRDEPALRQLLGRRAAGRARRLGWDRAAERAEDLLCGRLDRALEDPFAPEQIEPAQAMA